MLVVVRRMLFLACCVMCAVCCMVFVVCSLLMVVGCLFRVVCFLLPSVRWLLFANCSYWSSMCGVRCCLLLAVLSCVGGCVLLNIGCLLCVVCWYALLFVVC